MQTHPSCSRQWQINGGSPLWLPQQPLRRQIPLQTTVKQSKLKSTTVSILKTALKKDNNSGYVNWLDMLRTFQNKNQLVCKINDATWIGVAVMVL
jgi:hypothetical protein